MTRQGSLLLLSGARIADDIRCTIKRVILVSNVTAVLHYRLHTRLPKPFVRIRHALLIGIVLIPIETFIEIGVARQKKFGRFILECCRIVFERVQSLGELGDGFVGRISGNGITILLVRRP